MNLSGTARYASVRAGCQQRYATVRAAVSDGTLANGRVCMNRMQAYPQPRRTEFISAWCDILRSLHRPHERTRCAQVRIQFSQRSRTVVHTLHRCPTRAMVQLCSVLSRIVVARPLTSDETRDETAARGSGSRTRRIRLAAGDAPHLRKARMCCSGEQGNSEVLQRAVLCDRS
jgi:hypothetical protein